MNLLLALSLVAICMTTSAKSPGNIVKGGDAGIERNKEFDALKYLERAGYLDDLEDNKNRFHAPDNVKQALAEFQQYAGLRVSGRLGVATVAKMKEPRCGVPDVIRPSQRDRTMSQNEDGPLSYVLTGSKWHKHDLTYKFVNYAPELSPSSQRQVIADAFQKWSDVTPLNFKLIESGKADTNIEYIKGNHGDGKPFDGPGGVLAHTFPPGYADISGDFHLDSDENWIIGSGEGKSLKNVAVHELGHAIGLGHSKDKKAVMYPWYKKTDYELDQDDITGIQKLYGPRPKSTPKPLPNRPNHRFCNWRFDAIEQVHDNTIYAWSGHYIFTVTKDGISNETPSLDIYPKGPKSPDAVVYDRNTGKTFFFKDKQYWRFTGYSLDSGYPKDLSEDFWFIHAAWQRYDIDKNVYVLKGNTYAKWNESLTTFSQGYPKDLNTHFIGIPRNIDAIFKASNGFIYIFKGQRYWRYYEYNSYEVLSPNVGKDIRPFWLGCSAPSDEDEPLIFNS